jgi:hypothetical protein
MKVFLVHVTSALVKMNMSRTGCTRLSSYDRQVCEVRNKLLFICVFIEDNRPAT